MPSETNLVRVAAAFIAILAGCSTPTSTSNEPHGKAPTYVTLHTNDAASFVSNDPIDLRIGQGLEYATITFSARNSANPKEFFTGNVFVANAAVTDVDYKAELSFTGAAAGRSQLTRGFDPIDPATATVATSGTITIHRDKSTHRMTGTIDTHDATLAGTLSGQYSVTCLVPPEQLGQPNGGPGVLVMDSSFSTPFCRSFAALQ